MRIHDFILGAFAIAVMASSSLVADTVISSNFDGSAGTGPAFQSLTNGVGGAGSVNLATGEIANTTNGSNATGINNVSLLTLDPAATEFTATFEILSVSNADNIAANGFFLGVINGANATATNGGALFNNAGTNSLGLNLLQGGAGGGDNSAIVNNNGNPSDILIDLPDLSDPAVFSPIFTSIEDGFTFELTVRDNDTFSASSTGLSTDFDVSGSLSADASFADFRDNGIGLNASAQGASVRFFVDSATLHVTTPTAVPEPSSLALLGLASLGLVTRRRR